MNTFYKFIAAVKRRISLSIPSAIIFCIIVACFIYLVSTTWMRWGDLIIDTSRELFTPCQLIDGKVIYKDIFYPYGFLPPYVLAFLYVIFGAHINTAVACGLIVTIMMSVLLYRISRFFMNEVFSGLVVITFLFVFAFGHYVGNGIFNYILPYSCASTFFMLFSTAGLYFFLKFIIIGDIRNLFFWSTFMSLAFFSRIEYSIVTWGVYAIAASIVIVKTKNNKIAAIIPAIVSPLIICAFGYIIFLLAHNAFSGFKESIITCILANSTTTLNKTWFGMNDIMTNGLHTLGSFSLHVIAVAFLAISATMSHRILRAKEYSDFATMASILLAFFIFLLTGTYMSIFSQYRCLPLVLLTGAILYFVRTVYSAEYKNNLALLTLFLISLLNIMRIFFNTTPYNYGFFLLNMGLISYYVFFIVIFRDLFSKRLKINPFAYQTAVLVFFLLLIIPYWQHSQAMYGYKNLRVTTDRGTIASFANNRTGRFWETVDYLRRNTSANDTVVVFPEGASLNFFSHRDNPSRYHTFLPPDLDTVGEDKMLANLVKSNIGYLVILTRDTTEYGRPAFGFGYAKKIYSWIINNYEPVNQIGPSPNTSNDFGVTIFRRKGFR